MSSSAARAGKRDRLVAAAVLTSGVLLGCAPGPVEPEPDPALPPRPAPASGPYLHDAPDRYFQNVAEVLASAEDSTAQQALERLIETPVAKWLTGSPDSARQVIAQKLRAAGGADSIPVFVLYNIPDRDLGGQAGGGMPDGAAYESWIGAVSDSIGAAPAVVVLEPDALAGAPQLPPDEREQRLNLLRSAVATMHAANPHTAVYLDAGHSRWLEVETLASLVREVDPGGDLVRGLSFNVSNQRPEEEVRSYAQQVQEELSREFFVLIDNSMNGAPDTAELLEWCNPAGEQVGVLEDSWFDAEAPVEEVYVKVPGESDGRCGTSSAPPGAFDGALLLRQVGGS